MTMKEDNMKSRTLVSIGAILLSAAFTMPACVTATSTASVNPIPLINQPLVPDAVKPGGVGFTLTVNGTGFVSGAVVKWNGSPRTTTFVSGSRLTAAILATDIATAHTASVTVVNPTPGGGTSNEVFFDVTLPGPSIVLSAPSDFGTGSAADAVAVADFNGDGKLDLAVANNGSNNISVLLGNGDGTFQAAVDYGVGQAPGGMAVGDFNGDGKPDLVVANPTINSVSVLLGNGDGTFQAAANYGAGTNSNSVVVGDFNGDSKLDLAVPNPGSNNISVLLGNGDGTFQPAVNYASGGSALGGIAVGDFNRDGKLDLAVPNQYTGGPVSVFLGNGDGTFQAAVNYTVGSSPHAVAAADFNGDGKLDLAVANNISNDVSLLLGNGDGTFQPAINYAAGSGPNAVIVADVNGDGKLDLVIADAFANTVTVLLGKGDGTFQPAVEYIAGSQANSVVTGDFNRDGRLDLAVADVNAGAVSILLQAPTVSLSTASLTFAGQVIGTASAPQTVTLTNGGLPLTIGSIAVTGTNATDFSQTSSTCASLLPPGLSCIIRVISATTHIGLRTATVTITDNASGSPQEVALSGTGVAG
jgi:VCBS repeat protein/FG-GAP repeat protein